MTYSFDIFDTCLVRKCGTPDNLFDILARRAFSEEVDERYYQAFVIERKRAETCNWSKSQTLSQIYQEFFLPLDHIRSKEELIKLELACEEEMLTPVFAIKQKIGKLRKKGGRIIFISDMYLPESFIKDQLIRHNLFQNGDYVYVSANHDVAKFDGSLYKLIHEELRVPYHSWHHFGDNRTADIKIPRRLGIHAELVKNEYSLYQNMAKNIVCTGFNWPSILAGLSRSMVLAEEYHPHKLLYIDVILPLFTSLTYRILKKASEDGIDRLYFCARDAYQLYKIALHFQPQFPSLEINMLFISKVALYEGNQNNAITYFQKIGLACLTNDNTRCGIVDLRTSGKTLNKLNELLCKTGHAPVNGYFWEIVNTSDQHNGIESYSEINGAYIKLRRELENMVNHWMVYELFFPMNNLLRTVNYNLSGEPVYEQIRSCEMNIQNFDKWINWRDTTAKNYLCHFNMLGLVQNVDSIFEQFSIRTLETLFNRPSKPYIYAFDGITILPPPYNGLPYVKRTPFFLHYIYKRKVIWKKGTIALNLPTAINHLLSICERN